MAEDDDADTRGIRDELQAAINDVLAKRTEMTGHWVALVESYDEQGMRSVYIAADREAKGWDSSGLLTYGLNLEAAEIIAERLGAD